MEHPATIPLVQMFLQAEQDVDRAQMLLRMPTELVLAHQEQFRQALLKRPMAEASAYLEVRVSAAKSVRDPFGDHTLDHQLDLMITRYALLAKAGLLVVPGSAPEPPPVSAGDEARE